MLVLALFVAPLFVGALYITGMFIAGWRDGHFHIGFGVICLASLAATAVVTWIPLRRVIEAVRPGPVRVELPIDIAAPGPATQS
jgi:hypothetical protein